MNHSLYLDEFRMVKKLCQILICFFVDDFVKKFSELDGNIAKMIWLSEWDLEVKLIILYIEVFVSLPPLL